MLTDASTINALITTTGAKLISFFFIVVVQQKSRGFRYSSDGPSSGRFGESVVAFVYGFATTHKSSDQIMTWTAIVLKGK